MNQIKLFVVPFAGIPLQQLPPPSLYIPPKIFGYNYSYNVTNEYLS